LQLSTLQQTNRESQIEQYTDKKNSKKARTIKTSSMESFISVQSTLYHKSSLSL